MKKLLYGLLIIAIAGGLISCGGGGDDATSSKPESETGKIEKTEDASNVGAGDKVVYKLASDQPVDYPNTIALQEFADEIKEKTEGRITIEIYAGAQLGDENAYLQQLQFGAIDFAKSSVAPLAQYCDDLNALSLPYLFDSEEHMLKVMDGPLGQEIFDNFISANIVGLGYTNNGSRCFFTKKEVKSADDLENMKIRVQASPMMLGLVEKLGGFPQAIPSTDVYSSLQTGVVDGAENNINIYYNDSHYEQAPYYIYDRHNIQPEMVIASKMTWDSIAAADQEMIREGVKKSVERQRELWKEREGESLKKVLEGGATVYEPTKEELAGFREKCQPIYDDPELGLAYAEFVAKVREVK